MMMKALEFTLNPSKSQILTINKWSSFLQPINMRRVPVTTYGFTTKWGGTQRQSTIQKSVLVNAPATCRALHSVSSKMITTTASVNSTMRELLVASVRKGMAKILLDSVGWRRSARVKGAKRIVAGMGPAIYRVALRIVNVSLDLVTWVLMISVVGVRIRSLNSLTSANQAAPGS